MKQEPAVTSVLLHELSKEFWVTSGVMSFSQVALKAFAEQIPLSASAENSNPRLHLGAGNPNDSLVQADASWRKSDLDGAAAPDGWLQQWLSRAWTSLIYARWENYYRLRFARLHGVEKNSVSSNVMGDIRHLRHDVLHHDAVVTAGHMGKCKVFRWLTSGDRILLTPGDIRLMRDALSVEIDTKRA